MHSYYQAIADSAQEANGTMWPQHLAWSSPSSSLGHGHAAASSLAATTTKSPVLVILPPTHKYPDLDRVLKLARKAFDDLSLNILDLNLRFAWVSGDELVDDAVTPPSNSNPAVEPLPVMSAMPAIPTPRIDAHPAPNLSLPNSSVSYPAATESLKPVPVLHQSPPVPVPVPTPAPACASAGKVRIKEAELTCFRVFLTDLSPTLTDAEIFTICPDDIKIIGATFHPARPIGPKKSLVRSATLAFAKAKHAKEYLDWIKQATSTGLLTGKAAAKVVSTYFLAQGMSPEDMMDDKKKAAFYGSDADLPFALDAASLTVVPRTSGVPDDLPEADDGCWRFIVGNLIGSLTKKQILANIVPQGITLAGATIRDPKPLGDGRPEIVRDIKLAFQSEVDANACHAWIKKQAEPGGWVARIVIPTGKIALHMPCRPSVISDAAAQAQVVDTSSKTATATASPIQLTLSQLFAANLRQADSTAPYRLRVGNLNEHLSKEEMLAGLIPPGISPVGMSLMPQEQLSGRTEKCSFVLFEFFSERDVQVTHDWIRAEALPGGRVARLMPPNVKIIACVYKPAPGSSPLFPIKSAPSSSPDTSLSTGPSTSNLPEVDALAPYRLIVGNLLEHFTKAQLEAALIPPGMSPVGMTVRPPVQLSGRPELVLYVTFAYESEQQLEAAHNWVRAQAVPGGRLDRLFLPGVKLVCNMCKPGAVDPTEDVPQQNSTLTKPIASPAHFTPLNVASSTSLPEASPDRYRLHVSNLKPDLELAQIVSVLVPRDVKLVGASLFAPRPMGGSRRELVRSLKFAFMTESDAKRCQEWIKKDMGGSVAKVVLPGAKIVVGNPMDPMVSDPGPSEPRHPVLVGNPYALLADEQGGVHHPATPQMSPSVEQAQMRSPSLASTTTAASSTGESTTHSSSSTVTKSKQFRICINGIDPVKPVSTVFGTILGALTGPAAEPARMGIRNMEGQRGAEFVFDSESDAKQFVLQAWIAIQDGVFASVAAEGAELRIGRGSV